MGVDLRQVVAGVLTLTMFVMLGNMIKRDHFDSFENDQVVLVKEKLPGGASNFENERATLSEQGAGNFLRKSGGLWNEDDQQLKPCWDKPVLGDVEPTDGFVTMSLTNGPEYHVSQITNAVVVARYLGATLVLPDIRGSKPGDEMSFGDIYDVEKFVKSLDGVVRVAKVQPAEVSTRNLAVVKVPNLVTEDYIVEHVVPTYKQKGNIRLATYFPSVNMRKSAEKGSSESVACLAMFGTLNLQPEIQEVVDSMVDRLRTLSRKSDGQFIAVDLRVEMLEKKGCREKGDTGTKSCFNAEEVAIFLRKTGFDKDTPVYVTESRWQSSLDALKDLFPKTYTKESIMPAEKKKFLDSEGSEYEKVIDFFVCSQSDVFVPALSGLFYSNVAGQRIAASRTQIIVPAKLAHSSASASRFISPYVSKKNHVAYSCFC